jgi:hypothetical protein
MCHTDSTLLACASPSAWLPDVVLLICVAVRIVLEHKGSATLLKASFGIAVGLFKCSLAEVDSGCIVV